MYHSKSNNKHYYSFNDIWYYSGGACMSNTQIANIVTIGGISLALVIANLPLIPSLGILAITGISSCYFTEYKNKA